MVVVTKTQLINISEFTRFKDKLRHDRYNPFEYRSFASVYDDLYLAWDDTKTIVGASVLRKGQTPTSRFTAEVMVAVVPKSERKGVGSSLMLRMINDARKSGFRKLWLRCYEDNVAAIKFYQKFGFVVEGRFEKQEWDDVANKSLTVLSLGLFL